MVYLHSGILFNIKNELSTDTLTTWMNLIVMDWILLPPFLCRCHDLEVALPWGTEVTRGHKGWISNPVGLARIGRENTFSLSLSPSPQPSLLLARPQTCTQERPSEGTVRRWPSATFCKGTALTRHWSPWHLDLELYSFHEFEKVTFCYLSHPAFDLLLWHSWPAKTHKHCVEEKKPEMNDYIVY